MAKEMNVPVGMQIRAALTRLSNTDGLKRTQRWLAMQLGIGEVLLSNKINNNSFTEEELEKINHILRADIQL